MAPALKQFALRELLAEKRRTGSVSNESVNAIAERIGRNPRTIRRWIKLGEVPERDASRYEADSAALEALYATRGNKAHAARRLAAELGEGAPSPRTIRRAMTRDISLTERASIRTGSAGQMTNQVYRRFEAEHRNEIWEADHKELSLRVKYKGEIVSPWVTLVVDSKSRAIPGRMLSPSQPGAEDVLAALLVAFTTDENNPVGGIPATIRWDNDTSFTANSVTEFVAAVGAEAVPVDPYTPTQKGKIERLNRTVEELFSRCQPGWVHGPRERNGALYAREEVLLDWDEFTDRFDVFVTEYNTQHEHSSLNGRHPQDVWAEDDEPIRTISREELLKALPAENRRVGKDGIRYNGVTYFSADLHSLYGEQIQVRALPYDARRIEVYRDGEWFTSAVPHALVSDEDSDSFFQERGRLTSRINHRLRGQGGEGELVGAPAQAEPLHAVTENDVRQSNESIAAFLDELDEAA